MNDQTEVNDESRAEGESRLNDGLCAKRNRYALLSALFLKQNIERQKIFHECAKDMLKKRGRKARQNIRVMPKKALIRHLINKVHNVKLRGAL